MNPYIFELIHKERNKDMLQEVERIRLVTLIKASNSPRKASILIALGNILIKTGEKLKQRYSPKIELNADSCGGIFAD